MFERLAEDEKDRRQKKTRDDKGGVTKRIAASRGRKTGAAKLGTFAGRFVRLFRLMDRIPGGNAESGSSIIHHAD